MKVEITDFGCLFDGTITQKITLENRNNVKLILSDYGASTLGLICPDRTGKLDDIMLGFDSIDEYTKNRFFGCTVGRFANRISKGNFKLDDVQYHLNCNDGENHLHGGIKAWDTKVWKWKQEKSGILFELTSPDDDEKYPGVVHASVYYTLTDDNEVKIVFKATVSGKPTIINMTNHAYFNLSGQDCNDKILDHIIEIKASNYLPVDNVLIPTGEIRSVITDNAFNFLTPKPIGQDIEDAGGYDHNYCLDTNTGMMSLAARIYHKSSGRQVEVYTNQPGMQFYTGNGLEGQLGKNGNKYEKHCGFALEPQCYPDNVNQLSFPSSVVRPGETYERIITWKLTVN